MPLSTSSKHTAAELSVTDNGVTLSGRLDVHGAAALWEQASGTAAKAGGGALRVDAEALTYLDGAGVSLLLHMEDLAAQQGGRLDIHGLDEDQQALLTLYREAAPKPAQVEAPDRENFIAMVGERAVNTWNNFAGFVAFVGSLAAALGVALRAPHRVRWRDVWRTAEDAGVLGLPIMVTIGFLMGLILSFQSAVPLKRFGAELYVADLLGVSMVREMGALVTAIMLTGRSGSAFAAELGTMVVGEEVNALKTMGLSPVQFLAVPRVLGAMLVMPALTAFFVLAAFVGGSLVVTSFGYPMYTYLQRLTVMVSLADLGQGLLKSLVFSIVVAGVGCQKGLATGMGASAVGQSTTSAVVSGLTLIAVLDGIFAVVCYTLGI